MRHEQLVNAGLAGAVVVAALQVAALDSDGGALRVAVEPTFVGLFLLSLLLVAASVRAYFATRHDSAVHTAVWLAGATSRARKLARKGRP